MRVIPLRGRSPSIWASGVALWHLLSLDAPTVAVLWTAFTAAVTHTALPAGTLSAMGLAVWILYVLDRLLDTRSLVSGDDQIKSRHIFHHRHRIAFLVAMGISCCGLAVLLPRIPSADTQLYLVEGALLAVYFVLIHTKNHSNLALGRNSNDLAYPKEIVVGPFFAGAIFIPTILHTPGVRLSILPLAVLFAALCSLNCLYIYAWEHPDSSNRDWVTNYSTGHLKGVTLMYLAICASFCFYFSFVRPSTFLFGLYSGVCAGSALLLLATHKSRSSISPLMRRVAADAALLTPLLFLPFLR